MRKLLLLKQRPSKLEEELKDIKNIKAKLSALMQVNADMAMMSKVIDFLKDFEGDLSGVPGKPGDFVELIDCDCDKPGL